MDWEKVFCQSCVGSSRVSVSDGRVTEVESDFTEAEILL